jgi:hypothetical protein
MSRETKTVSAPVSSKLATVRASVSPVLEVSAVAIATMETLRKLDVDAIAARLRVLTTEAGSAEIEKGKLLVILDEQRGDKGTLQNYVRKNVGEISPAAYKVAKAFGMVGVGFGFAAEADFDACPLRWHLTTSAILNLLAKANDDELTAGTREEIAIVYRTRPADGAKRLASIKKCLSPQKGEGEGESEETGSETETNEKPDWRELVKAITIAVNDCETVEELQTMAQAFVALHTIATDKLEKLAPVAVAA